MAHTSYVADADSDWSKVTLFNSLLCVELSYRYQHIFNVGWDTVES